MAAVPDPLPVGDFLDHWGERSSLLLAQNCDWVQRSKVHLHSCADPEGQRPRMGWGEQGSMVDGPPSGHWERVQDGIQDLHL